MLAYGTQLELLDAFFVLPLSLSLPTPSLPTLPSAAMPFAHLYPHGPIPNPAARQPDQLTIEFRPDDHLIAVRWVGTCSLARLREVYERVAVLMARTESARVFFDTREREVIDEEAARWVANEAYATLLEGRTTPLRLAYAVPMAVYAAFGRGELRT